jgi:hypothetical protein
MILIWAICCPMTTTGGAVSLFSMLSYRTCYRSTVTQDNFR